MLSHCRIFQRGWIRKCYTRVKDKLGSLEGGVKINDALVGLGIFERSNEGMSTVLLHDGLRYVFRSYQD